MTTIQKYNLLSISLIFGLLSLLLVLPLCIYGGDGYYLWYPIIAEFLRGPEIYQKSIVIFDGQNLLGIYGDLPFWSILRHFSISIRSLLNITHWIFVTLLYLISIRIVQGMKQEKSYSDIIIVFFYCLLGPVIMNRVMEGHFNLLFGLLPLLIGIALIFEKSKTSLITYTLSLWCSFSIHSYQILAYHLFYIPILVYFIKQYENNLKKYSLLLTSTFIIAFLLSFPNFKQMLNQAFSQNSLRTLDQNIVYSYLTSIINDLWQFITIRSESNIWRIAPGYFHELNYPIGAFAISLFFIDRKDRFPIIISLLSIILFLFCMNMPGANFLADLPIIKSFRVPQRVFMMISFLIPLWCIGKSRDNIKPKLLLGALVILLLSQFIDYFDIFAFVAVATMSFRAEWRRSGPILLVALLGLFSGTISKVTPQIELEDQYEQMKSLLLSIKHNFSTSDLEKSDLSKLPI